MQLIKIFLKDSAALLILLATIGTFLFQSFANAKNTFISQGLVSLDNGAILINPILPYRWIFFTLAMLIIATCMVLLYLESFKNLEVHTNLILFLGWIGFVFGCLYQLAEPISSFNLFSNVFVFYLFSWAFSRYFFFYYSEA